MVDYTVPVKNPGEQLLSAETNQVGECIGPAPTRTVHLTADSTAGDAIIASTSATFESQIVNAPIALTSSDIVGTEYIIVPGTSNAVPIITLPDPATLSPGWQIYIFNATNDATVYKVADNLAVTVAELESATRFRIEWDGASFNGTNLYIAKLNFILDPAVFGNLDNSAWGNLHDGDYIIFGQDTDFSNFPAELGTLPAGRVDLMCNIRNTTVFEGVPASINHYDITYQFLSETDWSENGRPFRRGGTNFAEAITNGYKTTALTSDPTGEVNTLSNVGTGVGVFKQNNGADRELHGITGGTNVTVNLVGDDIEIAASSAGEANTTSNVGGGFEWANAKSVVDLPFKTALAGTSINITPAANTLTFSTTAEANTMSNVGGGGEVFKNKTIVDFVMRTIIGGTGISVVQNANDLTISTTGGGVTVPVQVRASTSTTQSLGNTVNETIIYDVVNENLGGGYDNITGIFTAPSAGVYSIYGSVEIFLAAAGEWKIFYNGSTIGDFGGGGGNLSQAQVSTGNGGTPIVRLANGEQVVVKAQQLSGFNGTRQNSPKNTLTITKIGD